MLSSFAEHADTSPVLRSKTIHLRFSLSYVKLFEISFKALENSRPFNPDCTRVTDLRPPLEQLPADYQVIVVRNEILQNEIPAIQCLPNLLRYAPQQTIYFYTDLRGGPQQAFKSMSSKTRSGITRKLRQFKEFCGGEIQWKEYRTRQELQTYFELARLVAQKTYQERLFDGGLPQTAEFRANTLELADRDCVRGFLLFHGEKPIAYLHTPAPDGFPVHDYLGYDPEYASHSPGTVLQYLALQSFYAEGKYPLYYWGYGYSQSKKIFSTGEVRGADIFYFRPTLRNHLAVRLHYATDRFSEGVGKFLEKLHLKQAIKRHLKK